MGTVPATQIDVINNKEPQARPSAHGITANLGFATKPTPAPAFGTKYDVAAYSPHLDENARQQGHQTTKQHSIFSVEFKLETADLTPKQESSFIEACRSLDIGDISATPPS
ncbi:hypothetical protein [Pseudomonas sp.]|uniref:hypothetical protein n=1 Tax=Pseudomonas sp. TaxID=306 RepID=UPI003BB57703